MKKTLIKVCLIGAIVFSLGTIHSQVDAIKVKVTTKIPGAACVQKTNAGGIPASGDCGPEGQGCFIECDVQPGFAGVTTLLGNLIRYATFIAGLAGVLFIVISGIRYTMSGASGDTEDAKKHIKQIAVGLILLFMSGYILYLIAPWVYTL